MAVVNPEKTEITAKIVYYGPGLSGKTTCIQHIYRSLPAPNKGKLLSLASDVDRTIFFDFLPLKLENVQGFLLRLQLYTVPGQVRYNATRKTVLQDIDGIVFVADLQKDMQKANEESMKNLFDNLKELGRGLGDIPHVFQYNKEDLPNTGRLEEMDANLNIYKAPTFHSCALTGQGVLDALKGVTKLVVADFRQRRVIEKHLAKASRDAHAAMKGEPGTRPATARPGATGAVPVAQPPADDASQLARRLLHSGIAAPTSRVAATGGHRAPTSTLGDAALDDAPPTLRLPRAGAQLDDAPRIRDDDKEIVVFSDRAEELTSGIHRRGRLPGPDLFAPAPAPAPGDGDDAPEALSAGDDTILEADLDIDASLATLPEDESHLLEIPEDPPAPVLAVEDTARHGALGARRDRRPGGRASALSGLVAPARAKALVAELEQRIDEDALESVPGLAKEALERLLDDPSVFPESDGMGPAARINVLAIRHRRFLRFREIVGRAAPSRDEALFLVHFLVDVSLAKQEVGH